MKLREALPYLTLEEAQQAGERIDVVIIVPFAGNQIVLCSNRWRGWEFPGGNVDWREPVRQAALRELREETGAACSSLEFVGVVWLERGAFRSFKAALYYAEVPADSGTFNFSDFYEIEEVRLFEALPDQSLLSFSCEHQLYELALQARLNHTIVTE